MGGVIEGECIPNVLEAEYWHGAAYERWVNRSSIARWSRSHGVRSPAIRGARARRGMNCGTTTLTAARAVAPTGSVTGLDVSNPMLARARESLIDDVPSRPR